MSKNDFIPRTETGTEKHDSYSKIMDRYNQAKQDGYYLECLVIIYARIEDYLDSILSKMDVAEIKGTKFIAKPEITADLVHAGYTVETNRSYVKIEGLSKKLELLAKIHDGSISDKEFWRDREAVMKAADTTTKYKQIKTKVLKWNRLRNQYTHALMKKQYEKAYASLPETLESGMELVKTLGNYRGRITTQIKHLKSNVVK